MLRTGAGPGHLSANTDLTNVSICYFDCGIIKVKSFGFFLTTFSAASDEIFMFIEEDSELQPFK